MSVYQREYGLIPKPIELKKFSGCFVINQNTVVCSTNETREIAGLFTDIISKSSGIQLANQQAYPPQDNYINFTCDSVELSKKASYNIDITENSVNIIAADAAGAFYASQTLLQLLPPQIFEKESLRLSDLTFPCLHIYDCPRFAHRGILLDVSRHFFSVEYIKKFIDVLAFYKMNVLHWHLTDDQGWRVQIDKYPKLTSVASYRPCSLIGHELERPRRYDSTPHSGFYTKDQIRDIVAYAQKRHVTIVPEIGLLGHVQAAIAAYPELGNNRNAEVRCHWGISRHIFNPFEETFDFIKDVIDEILELFPSEYIHTGGDEVDTYEWEESRDVQNYMLELGIANELELRNWFVGKIHKYLESRGRVPLCWDEISEGPLVGNPIVVSWRGVEPGISAVKNGYRCIMAPEEWTYLDRYYTKDNSQEPLAIGGCLPLSKVYEFDPIPDELKEKQNCVLGGQGQIWTEYITDSNCLEYRAFPRICALSEVLWSSLENKSYPEFLERLGLNLEFLDSLQINYRKPKNKQADVE